VADPNEDVEPKNEPTLTTGAGDEPSPAEPELFGDAGTPVDAVIVDGEVLPDAEIVPELLGDDDVDTTFVPAIPGDRFDELDPLEDAGDAHEFSFEQADAEIDAEIDAELRHEEALDSKSSGTGGGWTQGGTDDIVVRRFGAYARPDHARSGHRCRERGHRRRSSHLRTVPGHPVQSNNRGELRRDLRMGSSRQTTSGPSRAAWGIAGLLAAVGSSQPATLTDVYAFGTAA